MKLQIEGRRTIRAGIDEKSYYEIEAKRLNKDIALRHISEFDTKHSEVIYSLCPESASLYSGFFLSIAEKQCFRNCLFGCYDDTNYDELLFGDFAYHQLTYCHRIDDYLSENSCEQQIIQFAKNGKRKIRVNRRWFFSIQLPLNSDISFLQECERIASILQSVVGSETCLYQSYYGNTSTSSITLFLLGHN